MVNFEMNGEHTSSILGDRETVFSYSTSWRKITSVDCLCSQLYHRTLMFVSDKKKKKKKKKGLVTVQTFLRGHTIWIQFDIQGNICFCRKLSGQM